MEYLQSVLNDRHSLLSSDEHLNSIVDSVGLAISSISASATKRYFDDFHIGRKHASLSTSITRLLLFELEDRGWTLDYRLSLISHALEGSLYSFDAVSHFANNSKSVVSLDIAFDNRQKLGTLLLKPEITRTAHNAELDNLGDIKCHIQILATSLFKKSVGIDGSVGSYEEYLVAAGVFKEVLTVPTVVFGLSNIAKLKLIQRKGSDSRTKSHLIIEE